LQTFPVDLAPADENADAEAATEDSIAWLDEGVASKLPPDNADIETDAEVVATGAAELTL
jgi:hypothetical protein